MATKVRRILREIRPDVVISHMEAAARILHFLPYRRIYYIRTDLQRELEQLGERSRRRMFKRRRIYRRLFRGEHLLTVSEEIARRMEKAFGPARVRTLYTPFDFDRIRTLAREKAEIPKGEYILHIGRGSVKRHDILLEAFSKLEDRRLRLLLLGTEKTEKMAEWMWRFGLEESRVLFRPPVDNPYPLIRQARLLVLSSEREGLPRVLVEALALETPVVSTDCDTGPREILTGPLRAYLARVNDPEDLSEKIEAALRSYPRIEGEWVGKFDRERIRRSFLSFLRTMG
jgi:glycosyltransferase involved in cell wall biosynthesis